MIVGGSYRALAFALDALGNPFHEQFVSGRTASGQSIKTIFKSVEVPVALQSDVFDVCIEGGNQEANELGHFDLARPTFRANQLTTVDIRRTHLLSDSLGVRVAISDAAATMLATICRICSELSLKY